MKSELIIDHTVVRGTRIYTIKCWYGLWTKDYMIRYTWDNGAKRYTACKRIADPRAALFFISYSMLQCERHISGHTHTLARRALNACPSGHPSTPPRRGGSTYTPEQLRYQRTHPSTTHTYRALWTDTSK